jgi:hypothetical protein
MYLFGFKLMYGQVSVLQRYLLNKRESSNFQFLKLSGMIELRSIITDCVKLFTTHELAR